MSYISVGGGGGGSPGGTNGELQYNNSGSFGGIADYTSDGTNILGGGGIVGGPYAINPLLVVATGNLTLYVATTGSDSTGNGSSGNPYATIQHAINIATGFDYQNTFTATINVANGTYTIPLTITVPALMNCPQANLVGNHASPTSVVINAQSAAFSQAIIFSGPGIWFFDGFEIDAKLSQIAALNLMQLHIGNIALQDSSGNNDSQPFTSSYGAQITFKGSSSTITVLMAGIFAFAQSFSYGSIDFSTVNIVFPAALAVFEQFLSVTGSSAIVWANGISYTNFGGVTGPQLDMDVFGNLLTDNGTLSDIPGNAGFVAHDQTCSWINVNSNVFAQFFGDFSGTPSSSQIGTQLWAILKDSGQSAGFGTKIVVNDAGTVATIGPIGKFPVSGLPTGMAAGTKAFVTDALGPVFAATLTGGGGVFCPVYYDGTNWRAG